MPEFVILTTKQAARLKLSLLKAVEVLGGIDVPAIKERKPRKARAPKALPPAQSSIAQFQK